MLTYTLLSFSGYLSVFSIASCLPCRQGFGLYLWIRSTKLIVWDIHGGRSINVFWVTKCFIPQLHLILIIVLWDQDSAAWRGKWPAQDHTMWNQDLSLNLSDAKVQALGRCICQNVYLFWRRFKLQLAKVFLNWILSAVSSPSVIIHLHASFLTAYKQTVGFPAFVYAKLCQLSLLKSYSFKDQLECHLFYKIFPYHLARSDIVT